MPLSILRAYGLVRPMRQEGGQRRHDFVIEDAAYEFMERAVREQPSLAWYRERVELVMTLAGFRSGTSLKTTNTCTTNTERPSRDRDTVHQGAGFGAAPQAPGGAMTTARVTAAGWLGAIAQAAQMPIGTVQEVLGRHGVEPQAILPRRRCLCVRSVTLAGVKKGSAQDGPFDRTWKFGPGL